MYTISSEPHPVSRNASSGPCHGKARLTRDPQAFQVLRRREEKRETKKKKKEKITNRHLAIKLFDAGSPEKLSASEILFFMQRSVCQLLDKFCPLKIVDEQRFSYVVTLTFSLCFPIL